MMAPRLMSFKPMWTKLNINNRIENTVSPEKPVVPKRNPLSLSTSSSLLSPANLHSSKSGGSVTGKKARETNEDASRQQDEINTLSLSSAVLSYYGDKENAMHTSRSLDAGSNICSARSLKTPRKEDVISPQRRSKRDRPKVVKQELPLATSSPLSVSLQDISGYKAELIDDETDDLESGLFRALIFTDTHLGYKEGDPVRGNDAFNAFEEALYLAKNLRVDAIFHSGDLFDGSYPSRNVMYRTMDILQKYSRLGENKKPEDLLQIEYPKGAKVKRERKRNILISTLNLKVPLERHLPFFVIHGNHDNPNGTNDLSPIDLLDVANVVTYFGSASDLNQIELHPFLLRKGNHRVALYGLSWIKDESLYKAFSENRVKFIPPPDPESQWYHILLFHQNRYPRHSKSVKDYIPEEMLPDWLDLIIWGHEHECIRDPQAGMNRNFQVLQLGSTIQTSMAAAEMPSKHCCLMELSSDRVDFYPITLETARQLHYSEICLAHLGLEDNTEKAINEQLSAVVERILSEIKEREKTLLRASMLTKMVSSNNAFRLQDAIDDAARLPLVRLRIEHTGYHTINPRTFGNNFKDRIANAMEVLRFWQKRKRPSGTEDSPPLYIDSTQPEDTGNANVKQMVLSKLGEECRLKLLLERDLTGAVERFASGMEAQAISEYVRKSVSDAEAYLSKEMTAHSGDQMSEDIYNQIIERSLLTRTQAGRIGSSLLSVKSENDKNRDGSMLDVSFKSIPSYVSSPVHRPDPEFGLSITSAKNALMDLMMQSDSPSPINDALMGTPPRTSKPRQASSKTAATTNVKTRTLPKRSCSQSARYGRYSPPRTRRRNPLESIDMQTSRGTYEHVNPDAKNGEPLKLSDFDDITPVRNKGKADTPGISNEESSLSEVIYIGSGSSDRGASKMPQKEINGTKERKTRSSASSTKAANEKPSSNTDTSSVGYTQKTGSPGATNAIISMFFKPRKS